MKLAMNPSLSIRAVSNSAPTTAVRVAVATASCAGSPFGTATPSSAAVRMASVVVVLTLRTREEPRRP